MSPDEFSVWMTERKDKSKFIRSKLENSVH